MKADIAQNLYDAKERKIFVFEAGKLKLSRKLAEGEELRITKFQQIWLNFVASRPKKRRWRACDGDYRLRKRL